MNPNLSHKLALPNLKIHINSINIKKNLFFFINLKSAVNETTEYHR